jgi:hypothetical protein
VLFRRRETLARPGSVERCESGLRQPVRLDEKGESDGAQSRRQSIGPGDRTARGERRENAVDAETGDVGSIKVDALLARLVGETDGAGEFSSDTLVPNRIEGVPMFKARNEKRGE